MASAPPRRRPVLRARLVIVREQAVLLAHHRHPGRDFWCFPGGGAEPGETLAEAALREAGEETGLRVALRGVCFVQDRPEAEALDVYFAAEVAGGHLALGRDPERPADAAPVLAELAWVPLQALAARPVLPAALASALADGRYLTWGTLPVPAAG